MSYEIYTSIKYNKANRCFDCKSYSNNVYPKIAGAWTINYYAEKYPNASEDELKALLILGSLYNGDVYRVAWAKNYQNIARAWLEKSGLDLNYKLVEDIEQARQLDQFYKEYMNQRKKKYVLQRIFLDETSYIADLTRKTYFTTQDKAKAKVFQARTIEELKNIIGMQYLIERCNYKPIEI